MPTIFKNNSKKLDEENLSPGEKAAFRIEAGKKINLRNFLILWSVILVLVSLRMLLRFVGADPEALFASTIYFLSDIILFPFFGIVPYFRTEAVAGVMEFDFEAFLAFLCYTIIILLFAEVTVVLTKSRLTKRQETEAVKKDQPLKPTAVENEVE